MHADKNRKIMTIHTDWCKACGICTVFCPVDALKTDDYNRAVLPSSEACIQCETCVLKCPDYAISFVEAIHG